MTFYDLCLYLGQIHDVIKVKTNLGQREEVEQLIQLLQQFKEKDLLIIAASSPNAFMSVDVSRYQGKLDDIERRFQAAKISLPGELQKELGTVTEVRLFIKEYFETENNFIQRVSELQIEDILKQFERLPVQYKDKVTRAREALAFYKKLSNFLNIKPLPDCVDMIDGPGQGIMVLFSKFFSPDARFFQHAEFLVKIACEYLLLVELIAACKKINNYEFSQLEQGVLGDPFQRLGRYTFITEFYKKFRQVERLRYLFTGAYRDRFELKTLEYSPENLEVAIDANGKIKKTSRAEERRYVEQLAVLTDGVVQFFSKAHTLVEFIEKTLNPKIEAEVNSARLAQLIALHDHLVRILQLKDFMTWPDEKQAYISHIRAVALHMFKDTGGEDEPVFCHDIIFPEIKPFIDLYTRVSARCESQEEETTEAKQTDSETNRLRKNLKDYIRAGKYDQNLDHFVFASALSCQQPYFADYISNPRIKLGLQIVCALNIAEKIIGENISAELLDANTVPPNSLPGLLEYNQAEKAFHAAAVNLIQSGRYLQFPDCEAFLGRVLQLAQKIRANVKSALNNQNELHMLTVSCKAYTQLLLCQTADEAYTRIDHQSHEYKTDMHEEFPSDQVYCEFRRKAVAFIDGLKQFENQSANILGGYRALAERSKYCVKEALICSPLDPKHFRQPGAYEQAVHRAAAASIFPLQLYYLPEDPAVKRYQQLLQAVELSQRNDVTPILNTMLATGDFTFRAALADATSPKIVECLTLLVGATHGSDLGKLIAILNTAHISISFGHADVTKLLSTFLSNIDISKPFDQSQVKQYGQLLYDSLIAKYAQRDSEHEVYMPVTRHFELQISKIISKLNSMLELNDMIQFDVTDSLFNESSITVNDLFYALKIELKQLLERERELHAREKDLIALPTQEANEEQIQTFLEALLALWDSRFPQAQTDQNVDTSHENNKSKVKRHAEIILENLKAKKKQAETPNGSAANSELPPFDSATKSQPIPSTNSEKAQPAQPIVIAAPKRGRRLAFGLILLLTGIALISFAALAFLNPLFIPLVGVFLASQPVLAFATVLITAVFGLISATGGLTIAALAGQSPKTTTPVHEPTQNFQSKLGGPTETRTGPRVVDFVLTPTPPLHLPTGASTAKPSLDSVTPGAEVLPPPPAFPSEQVV